MDLLTTNGLEFLLRWVHLLAGVAWIGLLYYFNFVQGEWFKEADGAAKSAAIQKLVPRALAWFRYAALVTFVTGACIIGMRGANLSTDIVVGATLGTLMFLNVWLIIWPNQKIVIASTTQVAQGGQALPDAAAAGARAGLASRHNVLFSVPMLFFMGASSHLPSGSIQSASLAAVGACLLLIAALEGNAIKGKLGPMTTVTGVIHMGVALTAVLYVFTRFL